MIGIVNFSKAKDSEKISLKKQKNSCLYLTQSWDGSGNVIPLDATSGTN